MRQIPNILSVLRIVMVGIFAYLFQMGGRLPPFWSMCWRFSRIFWMAIWPGGMAGLRILESCWTRLRTSCSSLWRWSASILASSRRHFWCCLSCRLSRNCSWCLRRHHASPARGGVCGLVRKDCDRALCGRHYPVAAFVCISAVCTVGLLRPAGGDGLVVPCARSLRFAGFFPTSEAQEVLAGEHQEQE